MLAVASLLVVASSSSSSSSTLISAAASPTARTISNLSPVIRIGSDSESNSVDGDDHADDNRLPAEGQVRQHQRQQHPPPQQAQERIPTQNELTRRHPHLPQHRVRSPKRHVSYSENHPLARHRRKHDAMNGESHGREDDSEKREQYEWDDDLVVSNDAVVGGDASEFHRRRRRRQRREEEGPGSRLGDELAMQSRWQRQQRLEHEGRQSNEGTSYFQKFLQMFRRTADDDSNDSLVEHSGFTSVSLRNSRGRDRDFRRFTSLHGNQGEHADNHHYEQIQEGMVIMTANRGASGADSDNRHQTQHHNDGRDKPSSNVDRVRYWSITGRSLVFGEVYDNNRSTTTEPLAAAETALLSAAPSSTAPSSKAPTVFEATVTNNVSTWNETGAITANGTVDANILYQEYGYGVQSNYSHYNDSLALNNTDMMTSTLLAGQDFQLLPSQTESLSNSNANPLPDFATNSPLSETNPIDVNSHSGDDSQDPPSLYQPIRLQAILTDDSTSGSQFLTQRQRKILMEEMINPALYAWSRALYVVPVGSGGLDRSGSSSVAEGDNGKGEDGVSDREDGSEKDGMEAGTKEAPATLTIDRSQLYDGESCGPGLDSGLPSVRVPLEHIEDGLVGTDTVIYVSVAFAEGTGSSDRPRTGSNGDDEASSSLDADNMHFVYHGWRSSPLFVEGAVTAFSRGERNKTDDNTDPTTEKNQTSVFPSYPPSSMPSYSPSEEEPMVESRPTCPGTYLASATYCSTDQFDRPVAGILSLCIDNIHTFFYNQDQIQRNIVTIMHEMGHILGFNAQSLAHFRDGDTGEPLTPRDEFGDVPDTNVECTGVSPRVSSEIPLPSTNITKFQSVRGGVRVATVVTPTVRRITRNMFGCQELLGAELESGESQLFDTAIDDEELESPAFLSAGECIGDHWNRRLFRTDLLNPIVDDVPFSLFLSSLTLAYFADSGWYRVNSDRIAPASIWGRNSGCEFVQKKCINPNGLVSASNNPFFCNNFALPPAELPSTSKTKSQSKSTSSTTSNSKLLQESAPNLEEEEEVAVGIHGCDLDATRKAVCSLVEHELELPHEYTYFGKVGAHGQLLGGKDPTLDFCPIFEGYSNGQCNDKNAESVVGVNSLLEVFGEDNSRCVIGHVDRTRTALCLPIACVIQDQSLMIKVDGYWKRCMYAGQIISMWWSPKDYVVCPDPSRMCPTFFCPHDCFKEGGTCDYHSGECLCKLTRDSASANSTSTWFSSYYSSPLLEPCNVHPTSNSIHQVVERMDSELPDLYIANMTLLQDDPKNFDDKVSRMLAELSVGDVVGLVASFMLFVVFTYLFWSQLVRCYKQRVVESSISKVRSRVKSISRLLRDSGLPPRRHDEDGGPRMSSGSQQRRPPGNNPQKDKMVASLLVQMRTEATAAAEQEQQGRLQLGGLTNNTSSENDSSDANKECKTTTAHVQTTVNLSSPSDEEVTLHRSDLPPLPDGGRVIAVIGARIIEEPEQIENDDTRSSATSATHITSQSMSTSEVAGYESPLYQDGGESQNLHQQSRLRLRYGSRTDR